MSKEVDDDESASLTAVAFASKLRSKEIPSEGYQHRGGNVWDKGIAVALTALLDEAREQGKQAERERAIRLIGRIQGEFIASPAWRKCCTEILRRLEAE